MLLRREACRRRMSVVTGLGSIPWEATSDDLYASEFLSATDIVGGLWRLYERSAQRGQNAVTDSEAICSKRWDGPVLYWR